MEILSAGADRALKTASYCMNNRLHFLSVVLFWSASFL